MIQRPLTVTNPRTREKLLSGAKPSDMLTFVQATLVSQVSPGKRPEVRRRGISDHQTLSNFPKTKLKKPFRARKTLGSVDRFITKLKERKNKYRLKNLYVRLYNLQSNQVILRPIPSLHTPANLILNSFVNSFVQLSIRRT